MLNSIITLTSVTLMSLSALGQQRQRINVIGDLVVLNILYNGNAVDVKKLVAVTTVPGTNSVRIERTTQPGSVKASIRLIVPTTACERLPAYVLFRNGQLFFFLDESKRRITHKTSVCDKYEISYPLNYFNLEAAETGATSPGLLIPKVLLPRPFEFLESNNVADIDVPSDLNGTYVLSITKKESKILSAILYVKQSLGQDEYIIQTLP
ncbi:MAG: hypothetical protein B7Y39_12110 [Bdellovibrio sp. 28-41-41]|nr:MAG: hypothetical protein B7Y39_12110 [Bdellovibrio sp. 28-41-41]